jgi:tRNA A37 threonylcarbamoyladenosine biosynthesis protein TsaE
MLIEWPERVPALGAQADLQLELDFAGQGRAAKLTALSERAAGLALFD